MNKKVMFEIFFNTSNITKVQCGLIYISIPVIPKTAPHLLNPF
ncbi:MAG: hypothetical protein C5S40_00530 [ANME-2 cluster archaeon]|nr:hypothetical protein [ANME-2 cluster archaeon]